LSLINNTVQSALSSAHVAASTVLDMGGSVEVAATVAATAAVASAETATLAVAASATALTNTTAAVNLELAVSAAVVAALVDSDGGTATANTTLVVDIVVSIVTTGATEVSAELGSTVQVSDSSLDALADLGLPMECGSPPMPSNGIGLGLAWATNLVGTVASFACHAGYTIVGSTTRVCRVDKVWSGEATFCIAATPSPTPSITLPPTPWPTPVPTPPRHCLTPYEIPHGSISATGAKVWDQAYFDCFPPYQRLGPRTATCRVDDASPTLASWSLFPVCAKDVRVCSHIKCQFKMHSTLLKVSMQVDHSHCSRTRTRTHFMRHMPTDPLYHYQCSEQHGDMHHCEIDHVHQACVCKCWHKDEHPLATLVQEDLPWSGALETP